MIIPNLLGPPVSRAVAGQSLIRAMPVPQPRGRAQPLAEQHQAAMLQQPRPSVPATGSHVREHMSRRPPVEVHQPPQQNEWGQQRPLPAPAAVAPLAGPRPNPDKAGGYDLGDVFGDFLI